MRKTFFLLPALIFLMAAGAVLAAGKQSAMPAPQVSFLYFGADPAQTGAQQHSVTLLCIARNDGLTPIAADTLQIRCVALSGLDYTEGNLAPVLPLLAPGQTAACRWRLAPEQGGSPEIAAALLQPIDGSPSPSVIATAFLPNLAHPPRFGSPLPGTKTAPRVVHQPGSIWMSGNRVGLRIYSSSEGLPVLLLTAFDGTAWQTGAICTQLLTIKSAEEGQQPWEQPFRWESTEVGADKTSAYATLLGRVGQLWKASLTITVHQDTDVVQMGLQLIPIHDAQLLMVSMPHFMAGGTLQAVPADGNLRILLNSLSPLPSNSSVAAFNAGGVTSGMAWPLAPPLPGWSILPTMQDIGDLQMASAAWLAPTGPQTVVPAGTSVNFIFRIFAAAPSNTALDAQRFALP